MKKPQSPDVFGDEAIKTRLQDFQQAYEEATQSLANPTFRIATIKPEQR